MQKLTKTPIIQTLPTLQLVHRALQMHRNSPQPELFDTAEGVLSILILNLRRPRAMVSMVQYQQIKQLEMQIQEHQEAP
jgi:hypothetical protein